VGVRRYLIAVAVAQHRHEPAWDRPGLARARDEMIALFTGTFGYQLVTTVGLNPSAGELQRGLREFCVSVDRRPDDVVAVYFTGHGHRLDFTGEQVVLTADTRPEDIEGAVPARDLGRWMLLGTRVRRLLLMLDTCYSGAGGADLAAALTDFTRHWRDEDVAAGVVVISSAQPRQQAQALAFPRLLQVAVGNPATAGHGPGELAVGAVVEAMNTDPGRPVQQTVGWTTASLTAGTLPPFLPNPRREPASTAADLAIQRAVEWDTHAERRDVEFRSRLLVRAMGRQAENGWWFRGRHRALTDITDWLTHPDRYPPLRVVTGGPGSGKTAVLGLIAALTRPDYRPTVPISSLGLPADTVPAVGAIDVAIYAQTLTVEQVRDGIAAAAQIHAGTLGDLASQLAARPRPFTVLIDGLDEADEPDALARTLLRPLLQHTGGQLRLLIGTRAHLLERLGTSHDREIDLDADRYADRVALTAYAAHGLLEGDPQSAYAFAEPELVAAVAAAVAEQAYPSFLVAGIVSTTLSGAGRVPDPSDPQWRRSLPRLPGEAMRHDLEDRLGADATRARDLLRPLAFAQGQGLPWEDIWAPLASHIAGVTYTDEDLLWLRHHAVAYVVEAVETGRSAYRLCHHALAEHLREGTDLATIHAGFVHILRTRVPLGGDGHRDWTRAHPYTLAHLATHAAQAGLIDNLITDTDYLVHAEPSALLAAMHQVTTQPGRLVRAIYRCSAGWHRTLPPAQRRSVLAIDAARFQATHYQQTLSRTLTWRPRWATGHNTDHALRDTLTGYKDGVNEVACTTIDRVSVAVTCSGNADVRVWDLTTGAVCATLAGHDGQVNAVACTTIRGVPVAVTGGDDATVRVWDLDDAGTVPSVGAGHVARVGAVACTTIRDVPVAVTGSYDGTVRVWDLPTGALRTTLTGHKDSVEAVACTTIRDVPVAVTGGDDAIVRVWDLSTGIVCATLTGHEDLVYAVACTTIGGVPVAVTSDCYCIVKIWDLTTDTLTETIYCPEAISALAICSTKEIVASMIRDILILTKIG
jgi:hypothetical protein